MKFDRVLCFGDSITLGYNDSAGLGWPGRLCCELTHGDRRVAGYNLGVNGDTSKDKVHPGDDGYAMIAERIASWDKWLEKL